MRFFSIQYSLNNSVVGIYPQVEEAVYNCDVWNNPKFVDRVNFTKTNFEPIIANALLLKKAKLTDLISSDIIGFSLKLLISGKFKVLIQNSRDSGLQFYQSPVIYKDEKICDYWVLNPFEIDMQNVDFKSSTIYLMENTFTKIEQLPINTFNDFIDEKEKIKKRGYPFSILINSIRICKDVKSDFFVLLNVEGGVKYVVSEKLKLEMEASKCTGIEFMPIELSFNEWLGLGREREKIYGKV